MKELLFEITWKLCHRRGKGYKFDFVAENGMCRVSRSLGLKFRNKVVLSSGL